MSVLKISNVHLFCRLRVKTLVMALFYRYFRIIFLLKPGTREFRISFCFRTQLTMKAMPCANKSGILSLPRIKKRNFGLVLRHRKSLLRSVKGSLNHFHNFRRLRRKQRFSSSRESEHMGIYCLSLLANLPFTCRLV